MCGIAGIGGTVDGFDLASMSNRMIASLRHRGPDDEGWEVFSRSHGDQPVAMFANTRLAILDLSKAGHQPMRHQETGNGIVLNGEIYNHLEIRSALGEKAGRWHSGSDTETVLKAYAVWGPACLDRLRGMFALAIWDAA